MDQHHAAWTDAFAQSAASYRRMIDKTVSQLTDEELRRQPGESFNSVAILLRHLGGNLISRWTDFLTTDGEKPDRNRDTEFETWPGDRESLMQFFDRGWRAFESAIEQARQLDPNSEIFIRGESHTLSQAFVRSLTHTSYHIGQISMVARMVHAGDWNWLTIKPNESQQHNQETWGTKSSRSVFGKDEE